MLFMEIEFVLFDIDVESLVRDKPPFIERILGRMRQRYELVVSVKLRKREGCTPTDHFNRRIAQPFQFFYDRKKFLLCRNAVETANPHIDRVNFSPTEQSNKVVS